ncbi:MAG TPA: hypothetical protein VFK05_27210 [Polyangiaceae bacterium]|nr:hypothetical protein [Polyangiaceae bacterium]
MVRWRRRLLVAVSAALAVGAALRLTARKVSAPRAAPPVPQTSASGGPVLGGDCRSPGQLLWFKIFGGSQSDGLSALSDAGENWWAAGYTGAHGAATFPSRGWLLVGVADGRLVAKYTPDLPGPIRSAAHDGSSPLVVAFAEEGGAYRLFAENRTQAWALAGGEGTVWLGSLADDRVVVARHAKEGSSNDLVLSALDTRAGVEHWRTAMQFSSFEAAYAEKDAVTLCGHGSGVQSGWLGITQVGADGQLRFTRWVGHGPPDGCTDLFSSNGHVVVLGAFGEHLTMDGETLLDPTPVRGGPVDSFLLALGSTGKRETVLRLAGAELDARAVAVRDDQLFVAGSVSRQRNPPEGARRSALRGRFEDEDYRPAVRRIDSRGHVEWQWPAPELASQASAAGLGVVRDLMPWRGVLLAAGSFSGTLSIAADVNVTATEAYDGFVAALCP